MGAPADSLLGTKRRGVSTSWSRLDPLLEHSPRLSRKKFFLFLGRQVGPSPRLPVVSPPVFVFVSSSIMALFSCCSCDPETEEETQVNVEGVSLLLLLVSFYASPSRGRHAVVSCTSLRTPCSLSPSVSSMYTYTPCICTWAGACVDTYRCMDGYRQICTYIYVYILEHVWRWI